MSQNIENVKSRLEEDVYQQLMDGVGLETPPVEGGLDTKTNGATPPAESRVVPRANLPPNVKTRVQNALWFAKSGFGIIRIKPGSKVPSAKGWAKDPLTTKETVIHMLSTRDRSGHFPNYGITPLGTAVIIDSDNGLKGGRQRTGEANLTAEGDVTPTLTVMTPAGGYHRFYTVSDALTCSHKLPRDVDVKGNGGQVVGMGSELIEGLCGENDTPGLYS